MSSSTATLIEKAARALQNGKFSDARKLCARILKQDKTHVRALFMAGNCALQQEDFAASADYLERAVKQQPDAPEIVNNLGVACLHGGRLDDAVTHLKRAVELKPGYANAHLNLANAYKAAGDFAGAERHLRKTQSLSGNTPEIISDLADVLFQAQKWAEAADAYEALVAFSPDDALLRQRHAIALAGAGRTVEARDCLAAAKLDAAEHANTLADAGDVLMKVGRDLAAIELFREAAALDSGNVTAQAGLAQLYRRHVPRWHFTMLNDRTRNDAYNAVIEKIVRPGDVVLDIGSGSGLLAMMAARAGAKHVYSCEGEKLIAQKARAIVAANGFADRITVFDKWSTGLAVGEHMHARADVLVSEIVDNVLIGEGIIPTLEHALTDLVKPDARIVPLAGAVHLIAIECPELFAREAVDQASGFDVSSFNEFSSHGRRSSLSVTPGSYTALSQSTAAFEFNLTRPEFAAEAKKLSLECTRNGALHGVLAWFSMQVYDGFSIDNDPAREDNHWGHEVFFLRTPRAVSAGDTVEALAAHDKTTVNVTIE